MSDKQSITVQVTRLEAADLIQRARAALEFVRVTQRAIQDQWLYDWRERYNRARWYEKLLMNREPSTFDKMVHAPSFMPWADEPLQELVAGLVSVAPLSAESITIPASLLNTLRVVERRMKEQEG